MNLQEALQSATEGNFVSHKCFDSNQSMHKFNNSFYYEDGVNLNTNNFLNILGEEEWTKDGWYVKYGKESINKEKLKEMHNKNKNYLFLRDASYEDCIIKNTIE